ncbi:MULTISPECIES: DegT/DnrJ/EryC1/StrS family aminotransferase [unclassified Acinetobacter]|uniref:DegT/DnrJ/EryC1/StrS family aminotransferase n=1 Tax=unclassified Acinetobacter TaxID=196816 RepID=UPI0035B85CE5
MNVPFIDLKRFENGFLDTWNSKIASMSEKAQFIGGEEVSRLEQGLVDYTQVQYAVSCANGTDALQLALRAMGVGAGDDVLVPDMTFWATFEAVVNVSATPHTVDCDPVDGGVDIAAFKQAVETIKPKTAIIAHLYGWATSHLQEIRDFCKAQNVMLLEDGAQCFGAKFNGDSIYKDAYISTTSFYPAKVLGAAGDAGAVFTNDQALADKVRQLSNHGREQHYGYASVGWNSRLDSFQAAFLNLSLPHLDARIASRVKSVEYYHQHIKNEKVKVMPAPTGFAENGYCNVCIVEDKAFKEALQAHLKEKGIAFGNIYPSPLSHQVGAKGSIGQHFGQGQTLGYCDAVLNLPLFPYMTDAELQYVVDTVNNFTA